MNAQSNVPLSPHTGKPVKLLLSAHGIAQDDGSEYDPAMDSWDALRRNLTALMDACTDGLRSGPTGVLQLESVTGIGKSTLYRILDPREKNPTQLDTLEKIARAYELQVWQLLVPRLDPLDPPATIGGQRMAVLRSVFAQTHAAATDALDTGSHATQPRPSAGDSDPTHRVRAGGHPAVESAATRKRKPGRPRGY